MRFIIHLTLCLCLWLKLRTARGLVPDREEHRQFADSLTDELYENDNECTSSWGVSMLFDLLRPGGSGETLNQLCGIVGLCGSQDELLWNDTVNALTSKYEGQCNSAGDNGECYEKQPTLKIANSIWIDISRQLQPNYSEIVGDYLLQTDFASQDAGGKVNQWVNASTLGLIDSILEDGPISFHLLAINSIYLKASWMVPFNEDVTNEDLFYSDASRVEALSKKAHFMHTIRSVPYSDELLPGYQIVQLSYLTDRWNNELSMLVVLPLVVGADSVSSDQVLHVLPLLENRRVALALPKFRFESKYQDKLMSSLMTLGLTAPFAGQGFCGLIEDLCLFIELLIQKTFIEVNEKGTIAAAVTLAGLDGGMPPPDVPVLFLADNPFQFFIYDETEDLVLFEGRVGAPTIADDWPAAQFQPIHSDSDFWTSNFGVENPIQPSSSTTIDPPDTSASPESFVTGLTLLPLAAITLIGMA